MFLRTFLEIAVYRPVIRHFFPLSIESHRWETGRHPVVVGAALASSFILSNSVPNYLSTYLCMYVCLYARSTRRLACWPQQTKIAYNTAGWSHYACQASTWTAW